MIIVRLRPHFFFKKKSCYVYNEGIIKPRSIFFCKREFKTSCQIFPVVVFARNEV